MLILNSSAFVTYFELTSFTLIAMLTSNRDDIRREQEDNVPCLTVSWIKRIDLVIIFTFDVKRDFNKRLRIMDI